MGAIHWHRMKGLVVGGETSDCKKSRVIHLYWWLLGRELGGRLLWPVCFEFFLDSFTCLQMILLKTQTSQWWQTGWKKKTKKQTNEKLISGMRKVCDTLFAFSQSSLSQNLWLVTTVCHTDIHSGDLADDLSDLCLIAQWWQWWRRHDVILWCVK